MKFVLTHSDDGIKNIVILFDGVPYETDSTHTRWEDIIDLVLEDDPAVLELFTAIPQEVREQDSEDLRDALQVFFVSRGIDPFTTNAEDYSEEDATVLRQLCDKYGVPTCKDPCCRFCHASVNEFYEIDKTNTRDTDRQTIDGYKRRSEILESALKQYADHIWNDIEQLLSRDT